MSSDLFFNGKKYISARRAGQLTGYTPDYIGQISRVGKIPSKIIGRTRFVEEQALLHYQKHFGGHVAKEEVREETHHTIRDVVRTKKVEDAPPVSPQEKVEIESPYQPVLGNLFSVQPESLQRAGALLIAVFVATGAYAFAEDPSLGRTALQTAFTTTRSVAEQVATATQKISDTVGSAVGSVHVAVVFPNIPIGGMVQEAVTTITHRTADAVARVNNTIAREETAVVANITTTTLGIKNVVADISSFGSTLAENLPRIDVGVAVHTTSNSVASAFSSVGVDIGKGVGAFMSRVGHVRDSVVAFSLPKISLPSLPHFREISFLDFSAVSFAHVYTTLDALSGRVGVVADAYLSELNPIALVARTFALTDALGQQMGHDTAAGIALAGHWLHVLGDSTTNAVTSVAMLTGEQLGNGAFRVVAFANSLRGVSMHTPTFALPSIPSLTRVMQIGNDVVAYMYDTMRDVGVVTYESARHGQTFVSNFEDAFSARGVAMGNSLGNLIQQSGDRTATLYLAVRAAGSSASHLSPQNLLKGADATAATLASNVGSTTSSFFSNLFNTLRNGLDQSSLVVYNTINGFFAPSISNTPSTGSGQPTRVVTNNQPSPNLSPAGSGSPASRPSTAPQAPTRSVIVEGPRTIVERIIQQVPLANANGVTKEEMTQSLEALNNALRQEIYRYSSSLNGSPVVPTVSNYSPLALTNKIDTLNHVTITDATINGANFTGSISGLNFLSSSGGTLTGALTAPYLIALSTTTASVFPYASTTALTVGGPLFVNGSTTFNGVAYGWPLADGLVNQVLKTDGAGNLSWGTVSGGSGNTTFTIGNGYIYNATSSDQVLIGAISTTSTAKLEVIGNGYFSGNVGIGTTSPYAPLSVVGSGGVVAEKLFATSTTATSTFAGGLSLLGRLYDVNGTGGTNGSVLQTTGTGVSWVATSSLGLGTGDVVGPASATANAIVRYDSTTGKLIKNSGWTIDDSNILTASGVGTAPFIYPVSTGRLLVSTNNWGMDIDSNVGFIVAHNGQIGDFTVRTSGVAMPSDRQYQWGDSQNGSNTRDTGLSRLSAGVVGVTNGSTGGGALYANYFNATSTTATSTFAGDIIAPRIIGTTAATGGLVLDGSLGTAGTFTVTENGSFQSSSGLWYSPNGIQSIGFDNNDNLTGISTIGATNWEGPTNSTNYRFSGGEFLMGNNVFFSWTNGAWNSTRDVGLIRVSAGVLGITNGAGGGGALKADYFNATSTTATSTFAGDIIAPRIIGTTAATGGLVLDGSLGTAGNITITEANSIQINEGIASTAKIEFAPSVSGAPNLVRSGANLNLIDNTGSYTNTGLNTGYFTAQSASQPSTLRSTQIANTYSIAFSDGVDYNAAITRDALSGNALAQRVGTNAQAFRIYGTYTDANNYERLTASTTPGTSVTLAAETAGTGADNLNINLTPAGTGSVLVTTGNLGIGTTSPYAKLSVVGAGGIVAESFNATSTTATSTFAGALNFGSAGDAGLIRSAANRLRVTDGANGIGQLHASGAYLADTRFYDNSSITGLSGTNQPAVAISANNKYVGLATGGFFTISTSNNAENVLDTRLYVDGAGLWAMRQGTQAHALRIYGTYTDANNYERLSASTTQGVGVTLAAETAGTGADNLDINLTPAGTGNVSITSGGIKLNGCGTGCLIKGNGTSPDRILISTTGDVNNGLEVRNQDTHALLILGNSGVIVAETGSGFLAQRAGATPQTFRVYSTSDSNFNSYTNYERLALTGTAGSSVDIKAETAGTGAPNLNINLTPAGTGSVLVTTGNLGIGTTSPWAKLAVNPVVGDANQFVVGSSTATSFIINNAGKVGIGSTTPTYPLSITPTSSTTPALAIGAPSGYLFNNVFQVEPGFSDSSNGDVSLKLGSLTCASNCGDGVVIKAALNTIATNQPPRVEFYGANESSFINLRYAGWQNSNDGGQTIFQSSQGAFFSAAGATVGFASAGAAGVGNYDVGISYSALSGTPYLRVRNASNSNVGLLASTIYASSTTATSTFLGDLSLLGRLYDANGTGGTNGMVLQTTGTGVQWVATSSLGITGGSGPAAGAYIPGSSAPAVDAANGIWGESNNLAFEGATADAFETRITPTDPTADRTITLPNKSGFVALAQEGASTGAGNTVTDTFAGSFDLGFQNLSNNSAAQTCLRAWNDAANGLALCMKGSAFSGNILGVAAAGLGTILTGAGSGLAMGTSFAGNVYISANNLPYFMMDTSGRTHIGNGAASDTNTEPLTVLGNVLLTTGGLIMKSGGSNTLSITSAGNTASHTFQIANFSGTLAPVLSDLTTNQIDAANALWETSNGLKFEGATADANETFLTVTDPTAARTITLPNQSGTVIVSDASTGLVGIGTTTPWAKLAVNPVAGDTNAFVVGSSTATSFLVNNAGNIGIATTSPFTKLSVNGNFALTGGMYDSTGTLGSFGSVLTSNGTATVWTATSTLKIAHSDLTGLTTGDPHTQYALLAGRAGGQTIEGGTNTGDALILDGSAVAGDGGVKVTTDFIVNNPGVNGVIYLYTFGAHGTANYERMTLTGTTGYVNLSAESAGTGSANMNILLTPKGTGNVGIGTTSPYALLSVVGEVVARNFTATSTLGNATSTIAGALFIGLPAATSTGISSVFDSSSNDVNFRGISTRYYGNDTSGANFNSRKGRGTLDAPSAILSGDNTGGFVGQGWDGSAFGNAGQIVVRAAENFTTSAHGGALDFKTTPKGSTTLTNALTIDSTQNVGVASTSPWRTFAVTGTVGFSSSITAGTNGQYLCISQTTYEVLNGANCVPSSARYKDNIKDLTYGTADLRKLRPVSFTYKAEENMGTSTHIGFIAEEMNTVIPEVVNYDKDGLPESISYDNLTALLAKSLQEVDTRVTALESASTSPTVSVDSILANLASLGTTISQNVTHFVSAVADSFTVGSSAKPTGITLYDDVTGNPYCLKIHNGTPVSEPGACGTVNSTTTPPSTSPSSTTTPPSSTASGSPASSPSTTPDTTPPVITILGNNPANIFVGDTYVDLGATALDAVDGDRFVTTTGAVIDTSATGTYQVLYSASDVAGNVATSSRTVNVSAK